MPLPYCGAKFIGGWVVSGINFSGSKLSRGGGWGVEGENSPDTVASGIIHSFSKVSCGLSGTRLLTSQGKKQGLKYDFWLKYLKKKGLKSHFFSRTLTKVAVVVGGGGGSGGDGGGGGQNRGAYLPTSLKGFRAEAVCVCWWLWPMGKKHLTEWCTNRHHLVEKYAIVYCDDRCKNSYFNSRI